MALRDDVRNEIVLEHCDLVAQTELALFQPRQLQLVGHGCLCKRGNGAIEIAVFNPQNLQPLLDFLRCHIGAVSIMTGVVMTSRAQKNVALSITMFRHETTPQKHVLLPFPLGSGKEDHMESNHISALHAKHAGLEERLRTESARPIPDTLLMATIKKQKLAIKQEIQNLTN